MDDLSRIFRSPAVPLLIELYGQGFACSVTQAGALQVRPGVRLSDAQRTQLTRLKEEVVELLRCCDAGVGARREEFRRQIADSAAFPTFVFAPNTPYRRGWCFSCNEPLPTVKVCRCWRCSLAMRLALMNAGLSAPSPALDEARVA